MKTSKLSKNMNAKEVVNEVFSFLYPNDDENKYDETTKVTLINEYLKTMVNIEKNIQKARESVWKDNVFIK